VCLYYPLPDAILMREPFLGPLPLLLEARLLASANFRENSEDELLRTPYSGSPPSFHALGSIGTFQNRCAEMVIIEVLGSVGSRRKGEPMALIRLELHEHPASPQHEMRQKSVLDSGGTVVGTVANLYVDEGSRQLRFVDVLTSDFLGLERKHHLVPVEAVSDQDPGSITR
jgi:sporulation protein YlmC with PRC-barrel domain